MHGAEAHHRRPESVVAHEGRFRQDDENRSHILQVTHRIVLGGQRVDAGPYSRRGTTADSARAIYR
jgi:hypothetical protein